MNTPRRKPIPFVEIPINDVPSWEPVARPSGSRRTSQWDGVLAALERKPGIAAKINENDPATAQRYKSTLQTQAKNWGLDVKVRHVGKFIYAWLSEESGRYSPVRS